MKEELVQKDTRVRATNSEPNFLDSRIGTQVIMNWRSLCSPSTEDSARTSEDVTCLEGMVVRVNVVR